jgi:hypothetical protein
VPASLISTVRHQLNRFDDDLTEISAFKHPDKSARRRF